MNKVLQRCNKVLQRCAEHEQRDNFYPAQFPDWFENGNILIRGMINDGLLKED